TAPELPFHTPFGLNYDHGDFAKVLDDAMTAADWPGFERRRDEAAQRGRLRGIGMAHYVERVAGGWSESARIVIDESGKPTAVLATMSNGQGHETAYAQLIADRL